MAVSEARAHQTLNTELRSGGDPMWLGVTESPTATADQLAAVVPCPIPPIEVLRDVTTWTEPVALETHLAADAVAFGPATADCAPSSWVLFADEAMTSALIAGWLAGGGPVAAGRRMSFPGETVSIRHP